MTKSFLDICRTATPIVFCLLLPSSKNDLDIAEVQPSILRLKDLPENLIVIGDVIGQGGMGVVRAARQMLPLRDVAVKRLHFAKSHLAKNLMDEALTMGGLEHPNIVPEYCSSSPSH